MAADLSVSCFSFICLLEQLFGIDLATFLGGYVGLHSHLLTVVNCSTFVQPLPF